MIKGKLKRKKVLKILKKYNKYNVDFDMFIKCIEELKVKIGNYTYYPDMNFFTYGVRDNVNNRIYDFIKDRLKLSYYTYGNSNPHIPESYRERVIKEFKKYNYNLIINYLIEFVDIKTLRREDIPSYLNYDELDKIHKKYIEKGIICEQEKKIILGIIKEFENILNGCDIPNLFKCDICNKSMIVNTKSSKSNICINCENLEILKSEEKKIYNSPTFNLSNYFYSIKSRDEDLIQMKTRIVNKFCMNYSGDAVSKYKKNLEKLLMQITNINSISLDNKLEVFKCLYIEFDIHYIAPVYIKMMPGAEKDLDYSKFCEEISISHIINCLKTISTECFSNEMKQQAIKSLYSYMFDAVRNMNLEDLREENLSQDKKNI